MQNVRKTQAEHSMVFTLQELKTPVAGKINTGKKQSPTIQEKILKDQRRKG